MAILSSLCRYVVPLVWIPVAFGFPLLYSEYEGPLAAQALLFCAGIFIFTLIEYMLHRHVFHSLEDIVMQQTKDSPFAGVINCTHFVPGRAGI